MSNYLYCLKKKNSPRVHHTVCEKSCKRFRKCLYYKNWCEVTHDKSLIKKINKDKKKKSKKSRTKKLSK